MKTQFLSAQEGWICIIAFALNATAMEDNTNRLSEVERKAGWKLLFDGETAAGWQGPRGLPFPSQSWIVEDGMIQTQAKNDGGDIWTTGRYSNFELELDYKISPGGNSGVKYLVQPEWLSPLFQPDLPQARKRRLTLEAVGPEFQIFDDAVMSRKRGWEFSATGALYLLYAPRNKNLHPAGEWNHVRIIVNGMRVEHWLNGGKLLEYELGSSELLAKVEKTKFRRVPGFGLKGPGNIVLQHHNHPAWFQNIKIRELR